jgi:ATP-dependent RNA helicase DeaD
MTEEQTAFAARLLAEHTPEVIAAAYLRLYQGRRAAPEDLLPPDSKVAAREPKEFGPSRWISLSIGRDRNAEARWLLPLLCRAGELEKSAIGAIRVQDAETFVELSEASVEGFMGALGEDGVLEDGVTATLLEGQPNIPASSGPRREGGFKSQPRRGHDSKPSFRDSRPARADDDAALERMSRPARPAAADRGDRGERPTADARPAARRMSRDEDTRAVEVRPAKAPYKSKAPAAPYGKVRSDSRAPAGKYAGKPDYKSGGKPDYKSGGKPDYKSGGKPDYKSGGKPDYKSGGKPDYKSGGKPDYKAGGKPDYKAGGKPDYKAGGKPDYKAGGKPGAKPAGKPTGKPKAGFTADARDSSKRFTPPGKAVAAPRKPRTPRISGNDAPRRGKP